MLLPLFVLRGKLIFRKFVGHQSILFPKVRDIAGCFKPDDTILNSQENVFHLVSIKSADRQKRWKKTMGVHTTVLKV